MSATHHQKPVLNYPLADLIAEPHYAQDHMVHGIRLHGGFDQLGRYVSPRSLHRPAAIQAWTQALIERGGQPIAPDPQLLEGPSVPNVAQWAFLLRHGIWQPLWRMLTLTAMAEGHGRILAAWHVPNLQDVIHEDISQMAIGHWHQGLLQAHGLDEGGDPIANIGGHDTIWRLIRDLAFGELPTGDRPRIAPLNRIVPANLLEKILPETHNRFIASVINLFLLECRADVAFKYLIKIFESPELFPGREQQLQTALALTRRIQQDEQIHVESMALYLGEMRTVTFKCLNGESMPGQVLIERMWGARVDWTLKHQKRIDYFERRADIHALLRATAHGERLVAEFDALADSHPWIDDDHGTGPDAQP